MPITSIHSNVKKGISVQKVGKYNLIVGPNGSGKTSLINSIELALGGFVSDLNGKGIVKKSADLISLSNDGKQLTSTVTFEDGSESSFLLKATSRGAGRPKHSSAISVSFPFQEVKEGLSGSPDKAKKWIVEHILDNITTQTISDHFPTQLQSLYEQAWVSLSSSAKNLTEIDILNKIVENQKDQAKTLRSEIKTLEETKEEWSKTLTVKPTREEIQALQAKVDEAVAALTLFNQSQTKQDPISPAQIESALRRAQTLATDLKNVEEKREKLQGLDIQPLSEMETLTYHLFSRSNDIIVASRHLNAESCSVCSSYVADSSWDGHSKRLLNANAELEKKKQIHNLWSKLNEDAISLRNQSLKAVQEWKRLTEVQHVPFDHDKHSELKEVREQAGNDLMEAMQSISTWEDIGRLETRIKDKQVSLKEINKFTRAAKKVNGDLVQSAIDSVCDKVSAYLGGDRFSLEITATTLRYGLIRNEKMITALSGAEQLKVTLAIGAVLAEKKGEDLRILVPEDRALTPETLKALAEDLSQVDAQVFLTSTFPVELPPNWTTITLENNHE